MTDIGNRCVHCGEDTSFGTGRFVNRIPADSTCEAWDKTEKSYSRKASIGMDTLAPSV